MNFYQTMTCFDATLPAHLYLVGLWTVNTKLWLWWLSDDFRIIWENHLDTLQINQSLGWRERQVCVKLFTLLDDGICWTELCLGLLYGPSLKARPSCSSPLRPPEGRKPESWELSAGLSAPSEKCAQVSVGGKRRCCRASPSGPGAPAAPPACEQQGWWTTPAGCGGSVYCWSWHRGNCRWSWCRRGRAWPPEAAGRRCGSWAAAAEEENWNPPTQTCRAAAASSLSLSVHHPHLLLELNDIGIRLQMMERWSRLDSSTFTEACICLSLVCLN